MGRKATILDVAEAAGVSPSTVSHAISGKRPISADRKKIIFQKIRELDYRPNLFASSMRNREARRIGLVVDEWSNPRTAKLHGLLSEKFAEAGYELIFACSGVDSERGRRSLYAFSTGLVDGVINMLPQIPHDEAVLLCGNVPVLTYQRDDTAPLLVDYEEGTRKALEYLLELGHTKIGYLVSTTRWYRMEDTTVRFFLSCLQERGLPVSPQQTVQGMDTIEGGEEAMEKLFAACPVTAVLTGNDLMAYGVYRWAVGRGVSIPEELSVIGSDNIPFGKLIHPLLTTLDYPIGECADYTVKAMLTKIREPSARIPPARIVPELIVRASAPPRPV